MLVLYSDLGICSNSYCIEMSCVKLCKILNEILILTTANNRHNNNNIIFMLL